MAGPTTLQSIVFAYHIDLFLCKSISYRRFCLSSPPSSLSLSLRSDSPAFLTFPLRMLEIPSGCGLDDWLLLFQFQKCIYFSHFGPMHYSALYRITNDIKLTYFCLASAVNAFHYSDSEAYYIINYTALSKPFTVFSKAFCKSFEYLSVILKLSMQLMHLIQIDLPHFTCLCDLIQDDTLIKMFVWILTLTQMFH